MVAACARYWLANDADPMGCPSSHVPWSNSGLPDKLLMAVWRDVLSSMDK